MTFHFSMKIQLIETSSFSVSLYFWFWVCMIVLCAYIHMNSFTSICLPISYIYVHTHTYAYVCILMHIYTYTCVHVDTSTDHVDGIICMRTHGNGDHVHVVFTYPLSCMRMVLGFRRLPGVRKPTQLIVGLLFHVRMPLPFHTWYVLFYSL